MKKWKVLVPSIVWVGAVVEAETQEEAEELAEDMEFGLDHSPSLGGVIAAINRDMDMEACEPDYGLLEVYPEDE